MPELVLVPVHSTRNRAKYSGAIAELFALAWKHHQAGDLFQAELLYRHVVQADPRHADAWCFLGAACQAQGKPVEAEAAFRRAVQLMPCHPSAQNCLGILLAQQGKLEDAAACFLQLIDCQADDGDAYNNLGLVRAQQGRDADAIANYRQALKIQPDFAAARDNLATALRRQQTQGEPTPSPALAAAPAAASSHGNPVDDAAALEAKAVVRQGVAMARAGRFAEAKNLFEHAGRLHPTNADVHNNLGSLLVHQGKFDEAIAAYQEAARLNPSFCETFYNLGIALHKKNRHAEAKAAYLEALRLRPDHLDARNNLGNLHKELGCIDSALECYEDALRWTPNHPGTHFNRALTWLLKGDFARGLPEYEWRWQTSEFPPCAFRQPRWDGSPLGGRSILLHAEQGLGDTLQFVRYAPLVRERGGKVIVQCQAALTRILSQVQGIDRLVGRGTAFADFDFQAPLLSLPRILQTTLERLPNNVPYIHADPQLIDSWHHVLQRIAPLAAPGQGSRIGIAWQGSPTFRDDRLRSMPLRHFEPLAGFKGVHLISLQKGPGSEQLKQLNNRFPVVDLGTKLDEEHGAFMDTAAILKNLDLVITSDTALAHLAGAMAVPVWVVLPLTPDWRWLLHRTDSPWYPTMRVFRQRALGDWDDVFERVACQLKERLSS